MTCVIGLFSAPMIQLCSDRLVSVRYPDGTTAPHDPESNKAVLFQADDGIAALAYTYLAYVGESPTDTFIASSLAGKELADVREFTVGERVHRTVGMSVKNLVTRLNESKLDGSPRDGPNILVAGWTWKTLRGNMERGQAIAWTLVRGITGYHLSRDIVPRGTRLGIQSVPPGRVTRAQADTYFATLAATKHELDAAEVATARLNTEVSQVAESAGDATVGADALVITLPRPDLSGSVRIRYVPADGLGTSAHGAYTPWIVGPSFVVPPAEVSPWEFRTGRFAIQVLGPTIGPPVPGFRAQTRPSRRDLRPVARQPNADLT